MVFNKKLWFLVNPNAGKAAVRPRLLDITERFVRAGYEVTLFVTQRSGELPAIVERNAERFDLVVCCGGDGTLNETVNGLMRCKNPPRLGYIPAGTTNDFATSFRLPKNMVEAAEVAVSGMPTFFDVGRFGASHFAYVAAFGAFTDVPYQTPQETKNLLGKAAYVLEGAKRLPALHSFQMQIEHDGGSIEGDFLIGIISNSRYVAGMPVGVMVDASMNDGLMEVILVRRPSSILELTPVINGLLVGEIESKLITTFKTTNLHIVAKEPVPWTLDGEYGGTRTEVMASNIPQALCLMAPTPKK